MPLSGELKDISPYKKLEFGMAKNKYDKQRIFKDRAALRVYDKGFNNNCIYLYDI